MDVVVETATGTLYSNDMFDSLCSMELMVSFEIQSRASIDSRGLALLEIIGC